MIFTWCLLTPRWNQVKGHSCSRTTKHDFMSKKNNSDDSPGLALTAIQDSMGIANINSYDRQAAYALTIMSVRNF